MKYSEASKLIQDLSDDYSTNLYTGDISVFHDGYDVYYKGDLVVYVSTKEMYAVYPDNAYFYNLPYRNKLWMILSELAMTKPSDRVSEAKYNVIIGNNPHDHWGFDIWLKEVAGNFAQDVVSKDFLLEERAQFSPSEYSKLIEFIKTLPDGEFQAKVAEHGKTLVKED